MTHSPDLPDDPAPGATPSLLERTGAVVVALLALTFALAAGAAPAAFTLHVLSGSLGNLVGSLVP